MKTIIIWFVFVILMLANAHLLSQIKNEQLSKPGFEVYTDSLGQTVVYAVLKPTPNGYLLSDGTPLIIFPKELPKLDYDFINAFIYFRSIQLKIFK